MPLAANRFLEMMSELAVGWLLLDGRASPLEAKATLPNDDAAAKERAFYEGKAHAARVLRAQRPARACARTPRSSAARTARRSTSRSTRSPRSERRDTTRAARSRPLRLALESARLQPIIPAAMKKVDHTTLDEPASEVLPEGEVARGSSRSSRAGVRSSSRSPSPTAASRSVGPPTTACSMTSASRASTCASSTREGGSS